MPTYNFYYPLQNSQNGLLQIRLKSPPLGGGLGWGLVFNRKQSPIKVHFRPVWIGKFRTV